MTASGQDILTLGIIAAMAVLTGLYFDTPHFSRKTTLRNLDALVGPMKTNKRFALGTNANLDLVAAASTTIAKAVAASGGSLVSEEADIAEIGSLNDLQHVFNHYFAKSGAAERVCSNQEVMNSLALAAEATGNYTYSIGGNGGLMATHLHSLGAEVLLGGTVGPRLQGLFHDTIQLASPGAAADELHIILEYEEGVEIGSRKATRANRFIVSSTQYTGVMAGLEDFAAKLPEFRPDLVSFSGVHLLDNVDGHSRTERLQEVAQLIGSVRANHPRVPIHLELASVGSDAFLKQIIDMLLPEVDSIGLNEQELAHVFKVLDGTMPPSLSLNDLDTQVPVPRAVAHAIRHMASKSLRLSRVHFHSFAFHVIAMIERGTSAALWTGAPARSVAAGSLTATVKACGKSINNLHGSEVAIPLLHESLLVPTADPLHPRSPTGITGLFPSRQPGVVKLSHDDPVVEWTWHNEEVYSNPVHYYMAPVVACQNPQRTVGLGDAISAAGLATALK